MMSHSRVFYKYEINQNYSSYTSKCNTINHTLVRLKYVWQNFANREITILEI